MKKTECNTETIPIDTGGAVQFLTGIREQSPTFLIEYVTSKAIDREKLRAALKKALDVFQVFQVKLALSCPDRISTY